MLKSNIDGFFLYSKELLDFDVLHNIIMVIMHIKWF